MHRVLSWPLLNCSVTNQYVHTATPVFHMTKDLRGVRTGDRTKGVLTKAEIIGINSNLETSNHLISISQGITINRYMNFLLTLLKNYNYTHIHTNILIYIHEGILTPIYIYRYRYRYRYRYLCINMCICIYVYVYIRSIYMCIFLYTYTNIRTSIHA
jgi:hypothetical protein